MTLLTGDLPSRLQLYLFLFLIIRVIFRRLSMFRSQEVKHVKC
jgi:hypothetical protein